MTTLLVAEHDNAELKSATLVTIAAAQAIGGDIDVLVVGSGSDAVAQAAAAIPGVGKVVNGSARWIDLGLFNLQPSELAKVFIVMYIAAYLERHAEEVRDQWSGFLKPMLVLAVACVLLLHDYLILHDILLGD